MECYERSVVSLSMNPQNIEDLNVGPDIQYRQDTVWLNLLQKGKHVDLYKYTDAIKTRFYIKEKGTEIPVELVYHKYLNPKDNTKIIGLEQYKNQLANIASRYKEINTAELANLLPLTPYQQRSMEEIADFINKGTAQHFPATKIKPWHFYAGLAFSASKASYGGDHELAVGATNKMSYSPKLCFGIDIFSNPLVGKILFRFDLSFSMANYEIRKEKPNVLKIEQTFRQVTESLTPQVIYNFYNSSDFKLNMGTGLSLNISQYSNNVRQTDQLSTFFKSSYTDEVDFRSIWLTVPVRIGTVINKKFEFYGQYNYPITPLTDYVLYSISVQSLQLGFNYNF